jgi:hypothetical protein
VTHPRFFFFPTKVISNKNTMTEIRIEASSEDTPAGESCTHCAQRAQEEAESHETSFAFLLALMPLVVLTFFGQVGLL